MKRRSTYQAPNREWWEGIDEFLISTKVLPILNLTGLALAVVLVMQVAR